ncbi:MAG: hypothetical protein J6N71_07245 [Muribaculaceae bacterium]|nr:hypothetical protein [Muribaculaceae bacterium]HAP51209.1 hypothetical protein [Porphyromonadaceae bacterium]
MKPITNILLALALICYAFLPFYNISFQGSITGFEFTAGTISQHFGAFSLLKGLFPFIACFLAIGLNCLKKNWWAVGSIVLIALCIAFFVRVGQTYDIALLHAPEVTPADDLGQGFSVLGMGVGYKLSVGVLLLALVSSILSLLPFEFNHTIEQAVDGTIDRGIEGGRRQFQAIEHSVRDEWNKHTHKAAGPVKPDEPAKPQPPADPADHSRFMPK